MSAAGDLDEEIVVEMNGDALAQVDGSFSIHRSAGKREHLQER